MEITIRPKNFKLESSVQTQVRKRVERLSHHLDNLKSCEVLLTQEPTHFNAQRLQYVVQLTLRTRNNNLIRSEVRTPTSSPPPTRRWTASPARLSASKAATTRERRASRASASRPPK